MVAKLMERIRHLRDDPYLWDWLLPGLFGGLSGGAAVAWLIWGAPKLFQRAFCFVLTLPLTVLTYVVAAGLGITLVMLTWRVVKVIRRLTTPRAFSIWEPPEPMVELELLAWPHPGCGVAIYLPLILISAAGSLVWFYLAFSQAPLGWTVLAMAAGLLPALRMAYLEARQWRHNDQNLGR